MQGFRVPLKSSFKRIRKGLGVLFWGFRGKGCRGLGFL